MDTIKNFLLKIDGFIYRYYKLPTFLYFILFVIIVLNEFNLRALISVNSRSSYGDKLITIGINRNLEDILIAASPFIILYAWKRIFHPKD